MRPSANNFSSNWKVLQQELVEERRQLQKPSYADVLKKKRNRSKSAKRSQLNAPSTSGENVASKPEIDVNSVTRCIAVDCEYVGAGREGADNILARVSVVNQFGNKVYDKFVRPTEKVTDFRTRVSGIRPSQIKAGEDFVVVQKEVGDLLADRIVVGHALHNDFQVLKLSHPRKDVRDTSRYHPFRRLAKSKSTPSLKKLASEIMGVHVQTGEHDSVTDARVAMQLYQLHRKSWEMALKQKKRMQRK